MHSKEEFDAIWTPEAKAKVQQECGLGGGALMEKYSDFLAAGGWAQPGKKVVEVFAEWARQAGLAGPGKRAAGSMR
jgi:hypothetical protein